MQSWQNSYLIYEIGKNPEYFGSSPLDIYMHSRVDEE